MVLAYLAGCGNYNACSRSCGGGVQFCNKSCVNGQFGDVGCDESQKVQTQQCNEQPCKPRRWQQIYSQNTAMDFKTHCNLQSCDYKVDDSNFINFSHLSGMSSYNFKFVWNLSTGNSETLQWTQTQNPLAATNQDMRATNVQLGSGGAIQHFVGLSISSSSTTFIDGATYTDELWMYSVGYSHSGWNGGAQPAYISASGYVAAATSTALYVEMDAEGM